MADNPFYAKATPVTDSANAGEDGMPSKCPVQHGEMNSEASAEDGDASPATCPVMHDASPLPPPHDSTVQGEEPMGCPVFHGDASSMADGDVPHKASWPPVEGESGPFVTDTPQTEKRLSNVAVRSPIPRGDGKGDTTWSFPSPQRFYNALKRKGWNPNVEDVPVVVSLHNTINTETWRRVMEYEAMHQNECCEPKLKRFYRVFGKESDWSPKARVRSWLGFVKPFDRHDWFVDRCGKEVRYVIDFYSGKPSPDQSDEFPAVFLDVRPAVDSFEAVLDRVKMSLMERMPNLKPYFVPPKKVDAPVAATTTTSTASTASTE